MFFPLSPGKANWVSVIHTSVQKSLWLVLSSHYLVEVKGFNEGLKEELYCRRQALCEEGLVSLDPHTDSLRKVLVSPGHEADGDVSDCPKSTSSRRSRSRT